MFRYFLLLVSCFNLLSSNETIKEELNQIYYCQFKEVNSRSYFKVEARHNSENDLYKIIGDDNWRYFDYLTKEWVFNNPIPKEYSNFSPKRIQSEFILDLSNDDNFLMDFNYLESTIKDNSLSKNKISFKELVNLASNYFKLDSINSSGKLFWSFGPNEQYFNSPHNISIKSFCHLSMFKYMVSKDFPFIFDFTDNQEKINLLIKENGIDDSEVIGFAQNEMKNLMINNDNLIFVLMHTYQESKHFIGFEIIDQ